MLKKLGRLFISVNLLLAFTALHLNLVVEAVKVDCHPLAGATKEKCDALGCIWEPVGPNRKYHDPEFVFEPEHSSLSFDTDGRDTQGHSRVGEPWCYFPDDYLGYKPIQSTDNMIKLERVRPSSLGDDIKHLTVTSKYYERGHIARLTIEDSDHRRFQPEIPQLQAKFETDPSLSKSAFSVDIESKSNLGNEKGYILNIKRTQNGAVIFSTDLSKLIFSDKFIQLNTNLSSPFVYGLGEHYDTFLKWANMYKTYSFFNTDMVAAPGGTRSYGGFPFMVNFDSANQSMAHGIYLRNSNAMDIVLQNDLSVTFRPIGGILDFFLFSGPTPLDVTRQFQNLVGLPDLPPRWALGFHLCRYNYKSLERTKLVWDRTRKAGIPFDVQWNDLDYMEKGNDFTYDKRAYAGLPEFVDELHSKNMHYITLIDPGISQEENYYPYKLGTEMDIWIKNATNETLVGKVWNQSGRTVFPDFSNPMSTQYWVKMFVDFHKLVKIDGAWIDMNDISNFVQGSLDGCPWNDPLEQTPYQPGGYSLQTHTLCLSARHKVGREYNVHNLYSFYEAIATKKAMQSARPGRRSLIISRSSHPGQGHYSGHWSGDVLSNWNYLRWSVPSLLEHSMYGYSMIGTDICGFAGNTTVELCARWSTLGAFYTFSRNHNDDVSMDQDPVALGPEVVAANKNAYTKRYSLLPYLYTLVYKAHKQGVPVARSMAFEFFDQHSPEALNAEFQFMLGSAIMISPVVYEDTFIKSTYLPEGRWYETDILPESRSFDANEVKVPKKIDVEQGNKYYRYLTKDIAIHNIPIFYRGGHVVPIYAKVGATVFDTEHGQPIALEVALCHVGTARGEFYMDDGESVDDVVNHVRIAADATLGMVTIELIKDDYKKHVEFGWVKVLGLNGKVKSVEITSVNGRKTVGFKQRDHMLMLDMGGEPVMKGKQIRIRWT